MAVPTRTPAVVAAAVIVVLAGCGGSDDSSSGSTPPAKDTETKAPSSTSDRVAATTNDPCKLLTSADLSPTMSRASGAKTPVTVTTKPAPDTGPEYGKGCEYVGFGTYQVNVIKGTPAENKKAAQAGEREEDPGFRRLSAGVVTGWYSAVTERGTVTSGGGNRVWFTVTAGDDSMEKWFGDAMVDLLKKIGTRLKK